MAGRVYVPLPSPPEGLDEYRCRCEAARAAADGECPYDWAEAGL